MKPREILAAVLRCPVTTLVGLAAVAFTGWYWAGHDVTRWTLDARAFHGEPWRLLTSALPHGNVWHLAFNLYWLWVFGSQIEIAFGPARTAAVLALLAAGSGEAEYAVLDGGIGLSGVGYGLFGLLWMLGRHDARFYGAVDRRTTELFAGWFLLCIVLTMTDVMPVANFAHAAGWGLGVLIGAAIVAESKSRRTSYWLALAATLSLTTVASTAGRRFVNFSPHVGEDLAVMGYHALVDEDYPRAARWFESAIAANGRISGWWKDLGIAYQNLDRFAAAADAFQRAHDLDPSDAETKQAADYCRKRART